MEIIILYRTEAVLFVFISKGLWFGGNELQIGYFKVKEDFHVFSAYERGERG